MIYRGPDFLAVVRFGSSPSPIPSLSRQQDVSLSQSSCVSPVEFANGRGGGCLQGTKSYDRKTIKNSHLQVKFAQELTYIYAVCCIKKSEDRF
jgi:hypothetical protein